MDYFVFSLLCNVMDLLSALAPLLVTTALFLILLESLQDSRSDDRLTDGKRADRESLAVPRP